MRRKGDERKDGWINEGMSEEERDGRGVREIKE